MFRFSGSALFNSLPTKINEWSHFLLLSSLLNPTIFSIFSIDFPSFVDSISAQGTDQQKYDGDVIQLKCKHKIKD